MSSQETELATSHIHIPCLKTNRSSHGSVDSGCCDGEGSVKACSKPFDTFNLISSPQRQKYNHPFFLSHPTPPTRTSPTKPRSSVKDENGISAKAATETSQTGGGASYKYLTWREKDRRRRFREEWKHLWLVVPHGVYEVMCLVCHKIMTQRKLDTIKRHTIRRHAELLSMSETERQRLYHDLVTQYLRRGGDICIENDSLGVANIPRLRQTGPRGNRVDGTVVRKHLRSPFDSSSPLLRSRVNALRRSDVDKPSFIPPSPPEQILNQVKSPPALPTNLITFENALSNGLHSIFAKYLMGLHPSQLPPRGKLDPPTCPLWRRSPFPHTCGMVTPHAFQSFKKMPPSSSFLPPQRIIPDVYMDTLNGRAALDMSMSTAPPVQASPSDLSMRRCSSSASDAGTTLTERLVRLVNTWDTAAVLPTQSDAAALLLNR